MSAGPSMTGCLLVEQPAEVTRWPRGKALRFDTKALDRLSSAAAGRLAAMTQQAAARLCSSIGSPPTPAICGGRPASQGMRMRVSDILDMLASGTTGEEILQDYPYLTQTTSPRRACIRCVALLRSPEARFFMHCAAHMRLPHCAEGRIVRGRSRTANSGTGSRTLGSTWLRPSPKHRLRRACRPLPQGGGLAPLPATVLRIAFARLVRQSGGHCSSIRMPSGPLTKIWRMSESGSVCVLKAKPAALSSAVFWSKS